MNQLEFESPLPHEYNSLKPVPVAGFSFNKINGVNSVPKLFHFRKPKIKTGKVWYIEYYYRIPTDLKPLFNNKEWYRFRIKDDINRRQDDDRQRYAEWLRDYIEGQLNNGFNPFKKAIDFADNEFKPPPLSDEMNITDALQLFLNKWKDKGLELSTYKKYERYIFRLMEWLKLKSIPYKEASGITSDHIESFLDDTKQKLKFSNREYNNHLEFIRTAFIYLKNKKIITDNPFAGIEKQKTKITKHRFYDDKSLKEITRSLKELDPYLYLVFQTVYYTCIRADKEIRNLKVGNVNWQTGNILVEVSKTGQEYVPLDKHITPLLKKHIGNAPADYYIFGPLGKPSLTISSHGLFSKKFQKIREAMSLNENFTMYSAKHTRIIHLKMAGVPDADIMKLTRHKTFEAYSMYLRDLGMTANIKNVNDKSRKV